MSEFSGDLSANDSSGNKIQPMDGGGTISVIKERENCCNCLEEVLKLRQRNEILERENEELKKQIELITQLKGDLPNSIEGLMIQQMVEGDFEGQDDRCEEDSAEDEEEDDLSQITEDGEQDAGEKNNRKSPRKLKKRKISESKTEEGPSKPTEEKQKLKKRKKPRLKLPMTCPWVGCGKTIRTQTAFYRHQTMHERPKPVRARSAKSIYPRVCPFSDCEEMIPTGEAFFKHKEQFHDQLKGNHKCSFCEKVLPTRNARYRHEASHRNKNKFVCKYPDCSYSCSDAGRLKTHEDRHEGIKNSFCTW